MAASAIIAVSRQPQPRPPQQGPPAPQQGPPAPRPEPPQFVPQRPPPQGPPPQGPPPQQEPQPQQEPPLQEPDVRAPITPTTATLAGEGPRYCFDLTAAPNRVYGAIIGAAVGDAIGLQTEGDEPDTIKDRHPTGVQLPYKGAYKGYTAGDWTDATDASVLVMRSLSAYFGGQTEDPSTDFAARLISWHKNGFQELGDGLGLTPESVTTRAMLQSGFATNPADAARAVKGPKAENGATIRAIACAFTAAPADWATLYCETTHADERCVASTLTFTLLLNALTHAPDTGLIDPHIAVAPVSAGRDIISEPAPRQGEPPPQITRKSDYMARLTKTKQIAGLALGERDNRSYTLKTLACAMWTFRQLVRTPPAKRDADFFKAVIRQVVEQGGDSSANGAVAGAVLGAAMGIQGVPADWVAAMPHHKWLVTETEKFIAAVIPTWEIPPPAE